MRTSRVVLAGALALSGGLLAGCDKPPPSVTAFSGTYSERVAALCWAFEGQALKSSDCAQDIIAGSELGDAPRLPVRAGNTVGISVDHAIAEEGWVPAIAGQQLVNSPITDTYFRFTFPTGQMPADGVGLQILAGSNAQLRGVWAIRLVD